MPDDNSNSQSAQFPSQNNSSDPMFPVSDTPNETQAQDASQFQTPSTSTPIDTDPTNTTNQPPSDPQPNDSVNVQPQTFSTSPSTSPFVDNSDLQSGIPSDPASVISPQAPEKYGGKKVIATIFGVLLLVTAIGAGVYLVQQSVEYRNRAASGAACDQHPDCVLLDEPGNGGSYTAPRNISHLFITAKEYHRFDAQTTDNGCYRTTINGQMLEWQRYGSGPSCKDVSNIQIWLGEPAPTPPPQVSAECGTVIAYDDNWATLSAAQLKSLKAGDTVRFAVSGTASSGFFDKARFTINGQQQPETNSKKPGTEEFYMEYEIPEGLINFNVNAQVHHSSLGWF
jgi:hypothetical protein